MALVPSSSQAASSAVTSVTAADAAIVVGGTATLVTITTGRLDQIASLHAPTAAVPLNAQKITGVGAASAATDAATLAATLDQFAAPAANVAMATKKFTGLGNGSAAADSAVFGQIVPVATVTAAGDLIVGTGNATVGRLAVGTAGQIAGTLGTTPGYFTRATYAPATANPVGTTSATAVMMGLNSGVSAFTPTLTGNMLLFVSGSIASTVLAATINYTIQTGTGTGPANGAAGTGTTRGATGAITQAVASDLAQFVIVVPVLGLTVGQAYWMDLTLATTAGTATASRITFGAMEI